MTGDGTMFGTISRIKAIAGKRDELAAILASGSGEMPFCVSYVVAEDLADADVLWITEIWESEAHHASLSAVRQAIDNGRPLIASFDRTAQTRTIGARSPMSAVGWIAVDDYIVDHLFARDAALESTLAVNAAGDLPAFQVSETQGKMLQLFARMGGARRILEIGTLGGYSTIWLARALPEGGRLVTLELEPHYAEVARDNIARAGLIDRVDVRVGPAVETLDAMIAAAEGPFDLIFIDADKPNNVAYLKAAIALGRPGTTIVVDNVVRDGGVADPNSDDPSIRGTRALFEAIAAEPRLSATAVQTVGDKGWDGFLLALVD